MDGDLEITELALERPAGARGATRRSGTPSSPGTRSPRRSSSGSRARQARRPALVGRIDWAVAGCAAAIRSDLPGRTYMGNVVLPEYRGRGLGRALLERVVVAARAHGSDVLAAGVEEGDEAGERVRREVRPARGAPRARDLAPGGAATSPSPTLPTGSRLVELVQRARTSSVTSTRSRARPCRRCRSTRRSRCPRSSGGWRRTPPGRDVLPGGTLVALDGDRVVGFAGLIRRARRSAPRRARV